MKEVDSDNNNENAATPVEESPQDNIEDEKMKYKISISEKWTEIMKAIKEKTGIDGLYVVIFLLLCVILVYLGIFGTLITNMVGTLYPGFCTIKAMDKNVNKKDWLTYWVIFGVFIIVDMFSNIIMKIIPFYFVLKILFLIWMFLPGSNGCKLVYHFLILKLFSSFEDKVDYVFSESKQLTKQIVKESKIGGVKKMKQVYQGFKTFKGTLLNSKKNNMEEALKAAQELENEENNNKNNALRGKPTKSQEENYENDESGVFRSNIQLFPNRMEKKYFKDTLEEIKKSSQPQPENTPDNNDKKENNIQSELKTENNKEKLETIQEKKEEKVDENKNEVLSEEAKEKKDEEKKEEIPKNEESTNKDEQKKEEKELNNEPEKVNVDQENDIENLLSEPVFGDKKEENKEEEEKEDEKEDKEEKEEQKENKENKESEEKKEEGNNAQEEKKVDEKNETENNKEEEKKEEKKEGLLSEPVQEEHEEKKEEKNEGLLNEPVQEEHEEKKEEKNDGVLSEPV